MRRARSVLVLTALAAFAFGSGAAAQSGPASRTAPCTAAVAPERYGSVFKISDAFRTAVSRYRRSWATACAKGQGASIHTLLVRAQAVETEFAKVLAKSRIRGKAADRAHTLLAEVYPTFIPAFGGSLIEFEFFRARLDVLRSHARLGNEDDRRLFGAYDRLIGEDLKAPPWIQRTWDYGGCVRLGRWSSNGPKKPGYDFVAAASDVARLKVTLKGEWYRKRVAEFEARMLHSFGTLARRQEKGKPKVVDACGTRQEAERALERIASAYARGHSHYRRAAVAIRRTLREVAAGRTRICEKGSCPGG